MKTKLVNPNFKEKYVLNLLRARGIHDPDEYIEPTEECLQTPSDLENIERAEKLLKKIIKSRQKILIIVDCDNDGYTSATIIYNYLKDVDNTLEIDYLLHEGKAHGLQDHINNLMDEGKNYGLIILPDSSSNDYVYHE